MAAGPPPAPPRGRSRWPKARRAAGLQKDAHPAKLLIARLHELVDRQGQEFPRRTTQIHLQVAGHQMMIAVGAAQRLLDHRVDDFQFHQILGGHPKGLGGLFLVGVALPEDAGAAFRADYRIIGVFEHRDAIADPNAQRPAGAPLANDHANDRGGQARHLEHRVGDHLGLAALLRPDARIGARRIDEADDRQVKLRRQVHLGDRLSIALRVAQPKEQAWRSLVVRPF